MKALVNLKSCTYTHTLIKKGKGLRWKVLLLLVSDWLFSFGHSRIKSIHQEYGLDYKVMLLQTVTKLITSLKCQWQSGLNIFSWRNNYLLPVWYNLPTSILLLKIASITKESSIWSVSFTVASQPNHKRSRSHPQNMFFISAPISTDKPGAKINKNALLCQPARLHCKYCMECVRRSTCPTLRMTEHYFFLNPLSSQSVWTVCAEAEPLNSLSPLMCICWADETHPLNPFFVYQTESLVKYLPLQKGRNRLAVLERGN